MPSASARSRPTVSAPSSTEPARDPSACRTISSADVGKGTPTASSARPIRPPDISRTSQASASTQPPAIACPLTAATVGRGWSNTARNIRDSAVRNCSV